jgi:hypothetical protein
MPVWLYHVFRLNLQDVDLLLVERGSTKNVPGNRGTFYG